MAVNCSNQNEINFNYNILRKIGEGAFGKVFKAERDDGLVVAIKKTDALQNPAFLLCAEREIYFLRQLNHENIIKILDSYLSLKSNKKCVNLVMEYCKCDLAYILKSEFELSLPNIKYIIFHILQGLLYIHSNGIMHRDVKPANVLITKRGMIKLADFGLASKITKENDKEQNVEVVSLWYRAPELLLGYTYYGSNIDLWSVGCIMAELLTRRPIMAGSTNLSQLLHIIDICGSITPNVWPKVVNLNLYHQVELPQGKERKVKETLIPYIKNKYALDLIDKLLAIDPDRRVNSETALKHDFFKKKPYPRGLNILSAVCCE